MHISVRMSVHMSMHMAMHMFMRMSSRMPIHVEGAITTTVYKYLNIDELYKYL